MRQLAEPLAYSWFATRSRLMRLVAYCTVAAVLSLFMAASQHHHDSDAADRDCAICTAVVHHVVDLAAPPGLAPAVAFVAYMVATASPVTHQAAFQAVCPPICGPPLSL